jgi:hypothetical protein
MERFIQSFADLLAFVYHCFDRIVIHGYLSGLSRPEQVVYFFRQVLGMPVVSKEILSQRTNDYRGWVEGYARNHKIPMEWAEKGTRKEDYVLPALRRMEKQNAYGVYFKRLCGPLANSRFHHRPHHDPRPASKLEAALSNSQFTTTDSRTPCRPNEVSLSEGSQGWEQVLGFAQGISNL